MITCSRRKREARGSVDIPTFARAWQTFAREAAGFTSVNVNLAAAADRPLEFRYLDAQPSHERAFNTLVKGNLLIRRVPPAIQDGMPNGYAGPGSMDGSLPTSTSAHPTTPRRPRSATG